ncbi:MAG: hypothetical protein AB1349_00270 [Elusimicrobiota bacterium]
MSLSKINFLILVLAILMVVLISHRAVIIDEGVYLYAGKLVSEGKIPYLDFAHVQGPLFPVFYGLLNIVFGQDIYINRIVTTLFGLSGLIFGGLIAKKLGGKTAESIYFLFCITSIYILIHYIVVSTYAVTAFLLYSAVFFAVCKNKTILSYLVILFVSAIRLSVLVIIPILAAYLIIESENKKKIVWLLFTITVIFYSIIFLPFILKSSDVFLYNILGGHLGSISMKQRIITILDTFLANLKDYTVLAISFLISCIYFLKRKNKHLSKIVFILLSFSVLFITHLFPISNRGSYYNVLNIPFLFIVLGYVFANVFGRKKYIAVGLIVVLLLNFAEQVVLVNEHHLLQKENPIKKIDEVAGYIADNTKKSETILTFSTLLAVQSRRFIPDEFTEDCFSHKVGWSTDKCKRYKRVNNEIFADYISDPKIKLIAIEDFDMHRFGLQKKDILEKMEKKGFVFTKKFEDFGQWHDNLYIFVRQ